MTVRAFYDALAPWYHLVYHDWDASVQRQGAALAALIAERWGLGPCAVLDAALGVGTQALGLAARKFRVAGSDLSPAAVARARREAAARRLPLACCVADLRALAARSASVDVVIACDNALPHLGSEGEIRAALVECRRCLRPGGGCLVSTRDYAPPPPAGTVEVHSFGEREWAGRRCELRQVWAWRGEQYDLTFELAPVDGGGEKRTIATGATYVAIPVSRLEALMRDAGFDDVRRIDGRFFQPVLVGTRPAVA